MNESREYTIRPLLPSDQLLLWEMLYESLYVPEGGVPFERNVVYQAGIARYVKDWGRENDSGFVAADENNQAVGAIWLRLLKGEEKGYGFVDERTPELGMAVLPAYRNKGIGTRLLSRLIESTANSYEYISLSVAAGNPARRLYQRQGFEIVREENGSLTMKRRLKAG